MRKSRQLRVVAIGGGTGLSTLLRGLKFYVAPAPGTPQLAYAAPETKPPLIDELAAIVTVTDDGGSSGRLREDLNMLPPGDIRNCLVALSPDEALISRLFQYRFTGGDLQGHSFGNLFLAALTGITGDFGQAVQTSSQILASRGRIYPCTMANATISARMDDGSIVHGETNITASQRSITELMLTPTDAQALPEALDAIASADLITIGPGSLYTSLITNLLVRDVPQAIARSSATRVFICNLMTQANESLGLTASEHIERIYDHTRQPIFDYALINTAPIPEAARARYAAEGAEVIVADIKKIEAMGIRCITGDFADVGDVVRHASNRVADALLQIPLRDR